MKKIFIQPETERIDFDFEDIVTSSTCTSFCDEEQRPNTQTQTPGESIFSVDQ